MQTFGIFIAIAFFLSLSLVKVLVRQFSQKLIDIPNERSSHTKPTPRGGGLGFILSFYAVLGLSIFLEASDVSIPILLWISLIPLIVIGFIDDWKNLPASIRYLVQLSVSGIAISQLGAFPIFPEQSNYFFFSICAIVLTTVGMTALINFYNFMDGLDGLIAGTAMVQLGFCAIWNHNASLWILVAAIGGFLVWNWHPAKIFMGDSGSTFIGATIAIALLSKETHPADVWTALTITLPITLDTIYTLIQRLRKGENIFQAHRSHLFQRLNQVGWTHAKVASIYIGSSMLLCLTILTNLPYAGWINLLMSFAVLAVIENYLSKNRMLPTKSSDSVTAKS